MRIELGQFAVLTAAVGRWEEAFIAEAILSLPLGATVVDAGANVGRYTLIAGKHVGPTGTVIAFEPNVDVFRKLAQNVAYNNLNNVLLHNCALGMTEGKMNFYRSADHGRSSLYSKWLELVNHETAIREESVTVATLDAILNTLPNRTVDLCKVDVEGAELDVFEGAARALAQHQIRRIICELHEPLVAAGSIEKLLEHFGYRVELRPGYAIAYAE